MNIDYFKGKYIVYQHDGNGCIFRVEGYSEHASTLQSKEGYFHTSFVCVKFGNVLRSIKKQKRLINCDSVLKNYFCFDYDNLYVDDYLLNSLIDGKEKITLFNLVKMAIEEDAIAVSETVLEDLKNIMEN